MRLPNQSRDRRFGINMMPMIDVVFLLLIFFLTTLNVAKVDKQKEVDLSHGVTGLSQEEREAMTVTVTVNDAGDIFVGGFQKSLEELETLLVAKTDEFGRGVEVRIRASRRVRYKDVNPVMVACVESGIWDVKYAIVRPTGSTS